jgi:hypothetical protein
VASRAEGATGSLRTTLRTAAVDFYYHSLQLVAINVVWGAWLMVTILLVPVWLPGALVLAIGLALPTAGVFRIAALIARREDSGFRDGIDAWRRFLVPALVGSATVVLVGGILATNLIVGLQSDSLIGIALATLSFWGLVIGGLVLLCWWPLLVDPSREGPGAGRRALRSAAVLTLAHPFRIAALAVVIALLLAVSTVAFAALITIALSFSALAACHDVLLAADRLEIQLAARTP